MFDAGSNTKNFLIRTVSFMLSHVFWYIVSLFLCDSRNLKIFFLKIRLWLTVFQLCFMHLLCACFLSLLLASNFLPVQAYRIQDIILFSYAGWGLLCVPICNQFWRTIHGLLRRMCIFYCLLECSIAVH